MLGVVLIQTFLLLLNVLSLEYNDQFATTNLFTVGHGQTGRARPVQVQKRHHLRRRMARRQTARQRCLSIQGWQPLRRGICQRVPPRAWDLPEQGRFAVRRGMAQGGNAWDGHVDQKQPGQVRR